MSLLDCARPNSSRTASTSSRVRAVRWSRAPMAEYLAELAGKYPIISIEDGMAEDDWDGWKSFDRPRRQQVPAVGDDLFVTNSARPARRHQDGRRELHPRQGQTNRVAFGNLDAVETRPQARYNRRHVAPPPARPRIRRLPTLRSPPIAVRSDRLAATVPPARQVQPADPYRRAASAAGAICRPLRVARLIERRGHLILSAGRIALGPDDKRLTFACPKLLRVFPPCGGRRQAA